jgi:nucleoside-diphosphate-sugar epimerase
MSVLVTGATGFLGRHVLDVLLQQGSSVRVLCRPATRPPPLPDGAPSVDVVPGDLLDRRSVERAVDGCSEVLHLAAVIPRVNSDLAHMEAVNVEGTGHLLRAAARQGVARVVVASSTGVYGSERGSVDEDCSLRGRSPYALSKRAAEEQVERWFPEAVVLRLGLLFGPGSAFSDALVPYLVAMGGVRRLQRRRPTQWVAVGDAADVVVAASRQHGVEGLTANVAGREAPTLAHVRSLAADIWTSPTGLAGPHGRPWPRWVEYGLPYDISRAMARLGFDPGRALADEIARVVRSRWPARPAGGPAGPLVVPA